MSAYAKLAAETGDRYLAALAATQKNFLEFVSASRRMAPPMPTYPPASSATAGAKTIVDASYDFASKMLDQQEKFVTRLLAEQKPAKAAKASASTAAPSTDSKPKAVSKKAPAKASPAAGTTVKPSAPATGGTAK